MRDLYSEKTIFHKGIVQKHENESVTVTITSESACSGCHAEGTCSLSGKQDKIVDVKGHFDVNEGDSVTVIMKQSSGFTALFLGYLLPLIVLLSCLIIFTSLKYSEFISGLLAVASLVPYYLILYLLRKRIDDKFNFSIKV